MFIENGFGSKIIFSTKNLRGKYREKKNWFEKIFSEKNFDCKKFGSIKESDLKRFRSIDFGSVILLDKLGSWNLADNPRWNWGFEEEAQFWLSMSCENVNLNLVKKKRCAPETICPGDNLPWETTCPRDKIGKSSPF